MRSTPDEVRMVLVDPSHEELIAGAPWLLRALVPVPGYVVTVQHSIGLLAGSVRRQYRPFVRRLTADETTQALVLDAYVSCYSRRSQVRMLAIETRLGSRHGVPRLRRLRAISAPPD